MLVELAIADESVPLLEAEAAAQMPTNSKTGENVFNDILFRTRLIR